MVTALITVAAIAWLTQLAFGGWQIRRSIAPLIACASRAASASAAPPGASNRAPSSPSPSMKTTAFAIRC
jgi:hypothetical protein